MRGRGKVKFGLVSQARPHVRVWLARLKFGHGLADVA